MPTRLVTILLLAATGLAFQPAAFAFDAAADQQFTFAVRLMERGEHKLAEEAFVEFTKKHANDARSADSHYYLAVLARRRNDLPAAASFLEKVQNPVHVTPTALRMLRGQIKLEINKPAEAIADFEQIKAEDLKDATSLGTWHYLMGAAYRASNNPAAAADRFAAAAAADPAIKGQALLELGKARMELKQGDAAIESFKQALAAQATPDQVAEILSLAGNLSYDQKRYDEAAEYYKQIAQRYQASAFFQPALLGAIRSLYAAGKHDQVVVQYAATKDLIVDAHKAEALYLLGGSQVQLKQYKEGSATFLDFYRVTKGSHPLATEVAYQYAICFYQTDLEGFEKWMVDVEPALPQMPRRSDLEYMRAQAAIKRNKPADAVRYLTSLIDRGDNAYVARSLLQRAALREQMGQTAEAAADYSLYSDKFGSDPAAADASQRAIELAFRAGQFEKTIQLGEAWVAKKPPDASAVASVRVKVAVSQLKLERKADAIKSLDALLASNPPPAMAALGHYYRGVLLAAEKPGDPAAIAALQSAAAGQLPEDLKIDALVLIARQHRAAKRDAQALETYEQLRALRTPDKFDPATAAYVGHGLFSAGRDEAALLWLTPVIANTAAPESAKAEAMFYGGEALRRMQKFDAAIETYRKLVSSTRLYGEQGRLGLAHALAATGKTDEALKEYDTLISAQASEVAATALLQSGLIRLDKSRALAASNSQAAAAERAEARKRLNRAALLYDVPQLDYAVGRALVTLGILAAEDKDAELARRQFAAVTGRQQKSLWHDSAAAEVSLLDGQLGGAVALWRKIFRESSDSRIRAHAEARLRDNGEKP